MEIMPDENDVLLTNSEVHDILKEPLKRGPGIITNQAHATLRYETLLYMSDKPCASQSKEVMDKFLEAMQPYKDVLTDEEMINLINNRPTNPAEMSCMISEDHSDETVDEILKIIAECLPPPPKQHN